MFYEGRKQTTTHVSFSFGTWGRSPRIFTYIWHLKQVRINSIKFVKASLSSNCIVFAKAPCWQRGNGISDYCSLFQALRWLGWGESERHAKIWAPFLPLVSSRFTRLSRSLEQFRTSGGRIFSTFCVTRNITLRLWTTGNKKISHIYSSGYWYQVTSNKQLT